MPFAVQQDQLAELVASELRVESFESCHGLFRVVRQ